MSGRRPGGAGFTLIEVMVALVITSLVLGMVYSSFSAVMETRERVAASAHMNMTARLVLSRMAREIESAFIVQRAEDAPPESRYTIFEGSQEEINGLAADRISFTSFAHTKRGMNADESDQSVISYACEVFLDDEGKEEQLALMRREWRRIPPPGETQIQEPVAIPIAEGIAGFRLRFMPDGGEWEEEWNAADVRTIDALPVAVEITLSLEDGLGGVKAFT
ncbi:MAG: type II secretion system protein GspJ, partial [Myxococcota bacterium]